MAERREAEPSIRVVVSATPVLRLQARPMRDALASVAREIAAALHDAPTSGVCVPAATGVERMLVHPRNRSAVLDP